MRGRHRAAWTVWCWWVVLGCAGSHGATPAVDPGPDAAVPEADTCTDAFGRPAERDGPHWLAFTKQGGLWLIDLDDPASEAIRVSSAEERVFVRFPVEYAWSPDGTQLAYISELDGSSRLYLVDTSGHAPGAPQELARGDASAGWNELSALRWSPDGRLLAYQSASLETAEAALWLVDADAGPAATGPTSLGSITPGSLRWSPDADHLAFQTAEGERMLVAPGTDRRTSLGTVGVPVHEVAPGGFSPDGRWLVTLDGHIARHDLATDPPQATVLAPEGSAGLSISGMSWSDDGRYLATQLDLRTPIQVFDFGGGDASPRATLSIAEFRASAPFDTSPAENDFPVNDARWLPGQNVLLYADANETWSLRGANDPTESPLPIAPSSAGIVGFDEAGGVIWTDTAGIHLSPADAPQTPIALSPETDAYRDPASVAVAPNGRALARAPSDTSTDLVLSALDPACESLAVAFSAAAPWNSVIVRSGYFFGWLHDSSGLIQPTYAASDGSLRLELARVTADQVTVRVLAEADVADEPYFTWLQQPPPR